MMKKLLFLSALLLGFASSIFALSATGYGKSAKEAKAAALSELSNVVSANVKSSISTSTTVRGDDVKREAQAKLNVASNSYFQGVTYDEPLSEGKEYAVTAHLSKEGIKNTVKFLTKEIHQDLSKLYKKGLKELLRKSEMLYALANFTQTKSIIQNDVKKQEAEIQKYLSFGQVYFQVKPKTAALIIGNETYKPFQTHLISAKEHHYEISADGYHTEEGKFYISGAQKRTVKVTLIKKTANTPEIYIGKDSAYAQSAKEVLSKYGVGTSHSSLSTNAIKFSFKKQLVTTIDQMKVYNLVVTAEAFKGLKSVLTKRAKIKNVTDMNIESKKNKGVKALATYLLKKLKMDQFIGAKKVDYSRLF